MNRYDDIRSEVQNGTDEVTSEEDIPPSRESANQGANVDFRLDDLKDLTPQEKQLIQLRYKFSDKAYKLAKNSLKGWAIILGFYGSFKILLDREIFPENLMLGITTAVTLNVFAAFLVVIKGLFMPNEIKSKKDE